MTDMHHLPGTYTSVFGYERSAHQPDGHRNIFFADRTGEVVPFYMRNDARYALGKNPIGDIPGVGSQNLVRDDTKHLYEAVRRMAASRSRTPSGTRMGTDWRDNDPEIEPVVEIMQGARTNYEYVGAPLSAKSGEPADAPGGYEPVGMVRNAWNKGYRLGVTASLRPRLDALFLHDGVCRPHDAPRHPRRHAAQAHLRRNRQHSVGRAHGRSLHGR